jgi:hypothetical protein
MDTVVSIVDEGSGLIQQEAITSVTSSPPIPEGEVEHRGGVSPIEVPRPEGILQTDPAPREEGQRGAAEEMSEAEGETEANLFPRHSPLTVSSSV